MRPRPADQAREHRGSRRPTGAPEHSFLERVLDGIERLGNRMPHPVILFLALYGAVIVASQILYWFGWKATYEVVAPWS
jgi:aminobenzoyl-glutamate transport protein